MLKDVYALMNYVFFLHLIENVCVCVCSAQLKKKTLEVTVWDYDRYSSNDFLGEVSVIR